MRSQSSNGRYRLTRARLARKIEEANELVDLMERRGVTLPLCLRTIGTPYGRRFGVFTDVEVREQAAEDPQRTVFK